MSPLETHPYLVFSLIGTALAGLVCVVLRSARRELVCSGLSSAPSALLSILFIPSYWQPSHLLAWRVGPEDLLFSFASGVLVWALAAYKGPHLPAELDWLGAARRYLLVGAAFGTTWMMLLRSGVRVMDAACLAALVILAYLVLRAPRAWRLALRGGALFGFFYAGAVIACFLVAPEFADGWQGANLSGFQIGPAPAEELLWGFTYGSVWPPLCAFLWDAPDGRAGSRV